MTSLGSLAFTHTGRANGKTASQPLDLPTIATSIHNLTASAAGVSGPFGSYPALLASITAWTQQDDDAHDMCSLVACRTPLHPGPCKGWKGLLHDVSPGTYRQIEADRVEKANARRVKRIADLKSQGKPIPKRLLTEIKAKPAPKGQHNAASVQPVPHGQVNQKADLAAGQAHTAGQQVSKAAGITPNTAPALPKGPKGKKPSVAGRGPAFVITQPKVTDSYKIGKAEKITPAEWDALPAADKKAIRDELEAIKGRSFDGQTSRADALLAKLPMSTTVGSTLKTGTPGTITTPSGKVHPVVNLPGKTNLGQASKPVPATPTPQLPAPPPTPTRGTRDGNGILNKPHVGGQVKSTSVGLPKGYVISRDNMGYSLKLNGKLIRTSATQDALEKYAHEHHAGVAKALQNPNLHAAPPKAAAPSAPSAGKTDVADLVQQAHAPGVVLSPAARAHFYRQLDKAGYDSLPDANQKKVDDDLDELAKLGTPTQQQLAGELKAKFHPTAAAPAAPSGGLKPSAPLTPGTPPHIQHAAGVANRTAPKAQMSKTQVDAYGKLSKDNFDKLPAGSQKSIRDDLANAKAKFLDPKKQQAAQDLLDRFGSRHPTAGPAAAAPNGPSAPSAKGYSDPVNEAVKAASSGLISNDDVIRTAGRLSPDSVKTLDDADRKKIIGRLTFVATHPKATADQKAKAAAISRMITGGSPALTSRKWDHTPTFAELHAEEQTARSKANLAVDEALKAVDGTGMTDADRIKALTGLTKAQFDALTPDQQRKITDALQGLHHTRSSQANNYTSSLDPAVGKALATYTGEHAGVARLKQAEADFKAGKITGTAVHSAFLTARVQHPGTTDKPGKAAVEAEAARIARDNPTLPTWARTVLAGEPVYGKTTYSAISLAGMEHNWQDAPRLSQGDLRDIFAPTHADLLATDPIHRQAIYDFQQHILESGLKQGSPWSTATKNQAVDSLLGTSFNTPVVTDEKLKLFKDQSATAQRLAMNVVKQQIEDTTNDHTKTANFITLSQLEGKKFSPEVDAALYQASDRYGFHTPTDAYRKLQPYEYTSMPIYAQRSIDEHLRNAQTQAEKGGPVTSFGPGDNVLKVMPAALAAHLDGTRTPYTVRETRVAADLAKYGTKIVRPEDRVSAYLGVKTFDYKNMGTLDRQAIDDDLKKIANDSANPLGLRYNALLAGDFAHGNAIGRIDADQMLSISATNPTASTADNAVESALTDLSKQGYDDLDPVYRQAIDERIKSLPGTSQQALNAKFHPSASQAATPGGYTPTSTTGVPPHVQAAIDTIYGVHPSGKSHTMAHQLSTYGALYGSDFNQLNGQEQNHLLSDLSFIATTAKGPSADKARKLIDRFTPAGTPAGHVPTGAIIPPANALPGQVRYATPLHGLAKAKDSGTSGDGWFQQGGQRVWGKHGAAGLLLQHTDPATGEKRYLMVQRGPAISDPGKWTFPGGASDSKETPHEGATRETIEELGLKDDVFKDAQVHGDFTYSIPGSNWKYTSVAASVPTMIKPNLTTAHARAETSDAKWMTEAEIKALDSAGKLHHPIAGGKLQQNVISLFPPTAAAPGVKLGQIARPGPVTKRPGRLTLPTGGRQSPAVIPNAWTKPHKESRGKDLIPDKAAQDAFRQKIKQDRKLYDGKTADGRLAAIGAAQGFDDTPTVLDKKEIDRLLATGDYIEAWRGVVGAGGSGWRSSGGRHGGKTAAQINDEMKSGPAYYGKGIFGNGYYLATQYSVAKQYADSSKGSIVRILIPKSAVIRDYDKVKNEAFKNPRISKAKGAGGYDTSTLYDPGRYAAAKGIDGIQIESHHHSPSGGAGHVAARGKPAFNWLNRSVLILQKEPA